VRVFLKGAACFFCLVVYILAEVVLTVLFFFLAKETKRRCAARFIQMFTRCLCALLGIRVSLSGPISEIRKLRGAFFAPNHLSYIDGFAMAAAFPLIFVSKSDLKSWPVIGWMTQLSGTIFIDRGRKNLLLDSIREMARALAGGAHILFFPEGTTTNGTAMLPFKSTFFDAAVQSGAAVVPVSIVYHSVDGTPFSLANRDQICWYGDMGFWDHFVGLLRCRRIDMSLIVHTPIGMDISARSSDVRKELSDRTCAAVHDGVQFLRSS